MSLSRRLVGLTADQPRVESSLKPFEIINLIELDATFSRNQFNLKEF